jgi:hypothetical protein
VLYLECDRRFFCTFLNSSPIMHVSTSCRYPLLLVHRFYLRVAYFIIWKSPAVTQTQHSVTAIKPSCNLASFSQAPFCQISLLLFCFLFLYILCHGLLSSEDIIQSLAEIQLLITCDGSWNLNNPLCLQSVVFKDQAGEEYARNTRKENRKRVRKWEIYIAQHVILPLPPYGTRETT